MKACAKVCWCTQGIWTMIPEPGAKEPKASDAPCMSASVCNVKVFLHFHLVTNHASLLLPQRRDWLCYVCPLSPAVCVNAQGYKHTEKKKIQFTVAAFGAVPLDAGRSGIHDMLPPRVTEQDQ